MKTPTIFTIALVTAVNAQTIYSFKEAQTEFMTTILEDAKSLQDKISTPDMAEFSKLIDDLTKINIMNDSCVKSISEKCKPFYDNKLRATLEAYYSFRQKVLSKFLPTIQSVSNRRTQIESCIFALKIVASPSLDEFNRSNFKLVSAQVDPEDENTNTVTWKVQRTIDTNDYTPMLDKQLTAWQNACSNVIKSSDGTVNKFFTSELKKVNGTRYLSNYSLKFDESRIVGLNYQKDNAAVIALNDKVIFVDVIPQSIYPKPEVKADSIKIGTTSIKDSEVVFTYKILNSSEPDLIRLPSRLKQSKD